jgi:hypothetical protein
VVTVRTYLNHVQAVLAKSVLDDYEIPSALIHENAHIWSRAPFSVPIRLVVDEDWAELAGKILDGDLEGVAAIQEWETSRVSTEEIPPGSSSNNPWELLAIAFAFLAPACCALQIKYPDVPRTLGVRRQFAAVDVMHFFGWMGVIAAAIFVALYFYARREVRREGEGGEQTSELGDRKSEHGA